MQRVVRTCSGDDRNRDCFGHGRKQTQTFVVGEHRSLTSGSGNDESVIAIVLQPAS